MPLDTKAPMEIDGSPLPVHFLENFEKAENNIREIYGKSPSAADLLRMWIASATSWDIRVEFEETMMSIKRGMAQPNEDGEFDEDSFDF